MTYSYRAFGLNIASEFECPALPPHEGAADIQMRYGKTPDSIPNARAKGPYFEVKPDSLLFYIQDVARFYISEGRDIIVEPAEGSNDEAIRLFLLGIVFAGVFHQRGLLPLHGSAIETPEGVAVFVGHPGVGKSTLAGGFRKRNYQVFTDDLCVISPSEQGAPLVHPGYPEMKMTEESAGVLGVSTESLRNVEWWKRKYMVPFTDRFSDGPKTVSSIYLVSPTIDDQFAIEPIEGAERFQVVLAHTFRNTFLEGLGAGATHFRLAAAVASHARMNRVIRPVEGFRLEELLDLLEDDFCRVAV